MNQIAPYQSQEYKIKIVIMNGPLKGRSYKILSDQILIGRSPSGNDIVLDSDEFCSRNHALISKDPNSNKYLVEKISRNSKLFVNSREVKKNKILKNKDVLLVGKTELLVKMLPKSELALVPSNPLPPMRPRSSSSSSSNKKVKNKLPLSRLLLILMIPIILYFVLIDDSKSISKQKEVIALKTQQEFEDERTQLEVIQDKVQTQKKEFNNPSFKNAQIAYLKGMRDYRNGLFGRAQDNFRVCRTLYPSHKLCSGYLKKSQMKYEQLAQKNLILGKSYMEKKQYRQCAASFNIVLKMMSHDKNHKLFKEAKNHLKYCQLNMTGQY